jgi:hypothetical protein
VFEDGIAEDEIDRPVFNWPRLAWNQGAKLIDRRITLPRSIDVKANHFRDLPFEALQGATKFHGIFGVLASSAAKVNHDKRRTDKRVHPGVEGNGPIAVRETAKKGLGIEIFFVTCHCGSGPRGVST